MASMKTQRISQNSASKESSDPTAPVVSIEKVLAICYVLNARVADLETSNAELRSRLGLDPPPPTIGADWRVVKQAAGDLNCSESNVRKLIKAKKLDWTDRGRRILISASSIAAYLSSRCKIPS